MTSTNPALASAYWSGTSMSFAEWQKQERDLESIRARGVNEGRELERSRIKAIAEIAPDDPAFALDMILRNADAPAAKFAYQQVQAVRERERAAAQKHDAEIARLRALAETGGHPGVPVSPVTSDAEQDESPPTRSKPQERTLR